MVLIMLKDYLSINLLFVKVSKHNITTSKTHQTLFNTNSRFASFPFSGSNVVEKAIAPLNTINEIKEVCIERLNLYF